ncbi:hypothetical protein F8G81_18725 [Arthrobacter sp. CDRTa11]|uniref:hypothetical protein n=1 Tax=Arthrobacter sp. CDRTa11 TaxID=2651199 RepID=UPI002265D091|nr:hypothetical protein [Arthrobacter sp. CDRTa11]UZX04415.1 hypothetical protein F8G81_18725 [Arthrobacter sp. CDRTa11]
MLNEQQTAATTDIAFLHRVVDEADRHVGTLLETSDGGVAALPHRGAMSRLLALVTVFSEPRSAYYGQSGLQEPMGRCLDRLERLQGPAGLFDGTNLSSPPDTAFTINDACLALCLIDALADGAPEGVLRDGVLRDGVLRDGVLRDGVLRDVRHRLRQIVAGATGSLVGGGVHTPNHRWELSAALAQIHQLQLREGAPRPEIEARIGQWLAEGIDQLPDGMYSERSPLYATAVTNPSLLTIADSAGKPDLLDHVRRNLAAFLPWFNSDGSVESVFSRRQDQWLTFDATVFLMLYRRLANQDGRKDFAAAARWLEQFPLYAPDKLLARTRLDPWLAETLPGAGSTGAGAGAGMDDNVPLPDALAPAEASLDSCGVYRFRRGEAVTTVYGGCDELVPGVVSGLSANPTFLRFEHGSALLSDVRLSRSFFDLGPFRSQETAADGSSQVSLSETLAANFYLPLPPEKHCGDGIYSLTHEGRFSASMDFSSRPAVVHSLTTDVAVHVGENETVLEIGFDGADTSFALELTFRPGGVLEGAEPAGGADTFQLVEGTGSYRVGGHGIEFGPGNPTDPDNPPVYNPGEAYRYVNGTNATDGVKVYITGRTRGTHTFTLRGISLP